MPRSLGKTDYLLLWTNALDMSVHIDSRLQYLLPRNAASSLLKFILNELSQDVNLQYYF